MKFLVLVLVEFLSANVGFAYFGRPLEYLHDFNRQTLADALEHASRIRLGNAKITMQFHTGYALPIRDPQVDCSDPFLKDRFEDSIAVPVITLKYCLQPWQRKGVVMWR